MNPLQELQTTLERWLAKIASGEMTMPISASLSIIMDDGEQAHHTVYVGHDDGEGDTEQTDDHTDA